MFFDTNLFHTSGQTEDGDAAAEEDDDRMSRITLEQAEAMEKKKSKKEKNKASFGWDIFNQDSLYKAHKKRVATVRCDASYMTCCFLLRGNQVQRCSPT